MPEGYKKAEGNLGSLPAGLLSLTACGPGPQRPPAATTAAAGSGPHTPSTTPGDSNTKSLVQENTELLNLLPKLKEKPQFKESQLARVLKCFQKC